MKEIDKLRPARCFAGPRELAAVDNDVDRAGFAGVRAPGKRDLSAGVGNKLRRRVRALQE